MRIGIDARLYGIVGKGLGRYVSELIAALETIDSDNDYVVFLKKENFDEYVPKNLRFTKALADVRWYGLGEQLRMPGILAAHRLDLVHFPHFNVPLLYRGPFVVTIHDLILMSHPSTRATTLGPLAFAVKFFLYRFVIAAAIRRAKKIFTPSEFTKKEVLRYFPATVAEKIIPTLLAPGVRAVTAAETVTAKKPMALYVGNAYPHKNLERLLRTFAIFSQSFPDYELVLVGAPDYFYDRLKTLAAGSETGAKIRFFGKATDEQLAQLYAEASFYVFPSLSEGFGIPPLEAMASGVPVASSNATAMPEILGDAALYFDPADEADIAEKMRRLASDAGLRQELADRGKKRVQSYSWKECARRTLAAYREAIEKP